MTSAYDQGSIPKVELRHRLLIAREAAGMDQGELAARMGVSRSTISSAENGKGHARRTTLNAWALACGVPITWILTGQPPAGPDPDDGASHGSLPEPPVGIEPTHFAYKVAPLPALKRAA